MDSEESIFKNEYARLILALLVQQQTEIEKMLEDLEKELRLSNRFFPNSELAQVIQSLASMSSCNIKKGTLLYRCRLIDKENEAEYRKRLTEPFLSVVRKFLPAFDGKTAEEWIEFSLFFDQFPDEFIRLQEMNNQLSEQLSQPAFWGYDEIGSDAPPAGVSASGRVNPDGISYLYAAGDVRTAILEVRPVPTQYVSVAQIEVQEDITLYNFSKPMEVGEENKNLLAWTDYGEISRYFTRPCYGGSSYYLATQYISEYIKHIKGIDGRAAFDGLCFQSSLNCDGINYVLFDVSHEKKYRICNSSLYQVEDLLGNSKRILPIEDC